MRIKLVWIIFMILPFTLVGTQPVQTQISPQTYRNGDQKINSTQLLPKHENDSDEDGQIISVRITSSVAVGRGTFDGKPGLETHDVEQTTITTPTADVTGSFVTATNYESMTTTFTEALTDYPPHLAGANIEFIKQLQAKKETRALLIPEPAYQIQTSYEMSNNTEQDPLLQETINENDKDIEDIPLARSIPLSYSSKSFIHRQGDNNQKLTTVSFNIVHERPKLLNYNKQNSASGDTNLSARKFYNEPSKVYSEPAQIYSEPAKFYSEPAKIYSEPAKIYSEPAKVYSEPAKIYSEPAKFYSEPASLHLSPKSIPTNRNTWLPQTGTTSFSSTYSTTTSNPLYPKNLDKRIEHQPEKNYEVDEKVSVQTDGRSHGEQANNPENCKQENCKVGYVVEGRQFRKYRVEERTSDGFIVGEYGVVRNEDGALRGVRYTADSEASPRLIHDALMKFLQLK
ncbi:uncharacterized protein LOC110998461 [Pieris rapae]|uniref:uncharacterized protein LOC110998461 n=1 Tax=Pieris rapae TaxID=64459 RepID=UPI001E27C4AF|nr:uncharacterized protein LOC110998461 [Pieris rapae]